MTEDKLLAQITKKIPLMEAFGPTFQGEGALCGHQTYFLRFGLCDYKCTMCIESDQRVMMADWSYKPISQLVVGDMVMGTSRSSEKLSRLQIKPTRVLNVINQGVKKVIEVKTPNGSLICTPDHQLLNTKWRNYWQPANTCHNAQLRTLPIYEPKGNFNLGWLHGIIAGDGSVYKLQDKWWRMKVCMGRQDAAVIDKVHAELLNLGLNPHFIEHDGGHEGYDKLIGVEVTNHKAVSDFRDAYLFGMDDDVDYIAGWLSGFFDTDGHYDKYSNSVRISQSLKKNAWKIERLEQYLEMLNLPFNVQKGVNDAGNDTKTIIVSRTAEFFTQCRPFLQRKYPEGFGIGKYPELPVVSIEPIDQPVNVWDITTESGDFIVEGIIAHNCDSMHAVDPIQVKANAKWLTQPEILTHFTGVLQQSPAGNIAPWITFSGGNPCIHDLTFIVESFRKHGFRLNVETQGTKCPDWLNNVDMITISPKSPGMGEKYNKEEFQYMLQYAHNWQVPVCIKVVVFSNRDLEFAAMVFDDAKETGITDGFYMSLGNPYPPQHSNTDGLIAHIEAGHGSSFDDELKLRLLADYKTLCEEILQDPRFSNVVFLPQLHVLTWANLAEV